MAIAVQTNLARPADLDRTSLFSVTSLGTAVRPSCKRVTTTNPSDQRVTPVGCQVDSDDLDYLDDLSADASSTHKPEENADARYKAAEKRISQMTANEIPAAAKKSSAEMFPDAQPELSNLQVSLPIRMLRTTEETVEDMWSSQRKVEVTKRQKEGLMFACRDYRQLRKQNNLRLWAKHVTRLPQEVLNHQPAKSPAELEYEAERRLLLLGKLHVLLVERTGKSTGRRAESAAQSPRAAHARARAQAGAGGAQSLPREVVTSKPRGVRKSNSQGKKRVTIMAPGEEDSFERASFRWAAFSAKM